MHLYPKQTKSTVATLMTVGCLIQQLNATIVIPACMLCSQQQASAATTQINNTKFCLRLTFFTAIMDQHNHIQTIDINEFDAMVIMEGRMHNNMWETCISTNFLTTSCILLPLYLLQSQERCLK